MPLPLIPKISAPTASGTLVPHAVGGMIVTSATGYVAGTYQRVTGCPDCARRSCNTKSAKVANHESR